MNGSLLADAVLFSTFRRPPLNPPFVRVSKARPCCYRGEILLHTDHFDAFAYISRKAAMRWSRRPAPPAPSSGDEIHRWAVAREVERPAA